MGLIGFLYRPLLDGVPQGYYRPDSRAGGLLLGCVLALMLQYESWRKVAGWPLVGWLGASLVIAAPLGAGHGRVDYLRECVPVATVGAALLVAGLTNRRTGVLSRVLS